MNIKDRINFKMLREKGPSSIDIQKDEVVQLITRGQSIKYIVDSEHYLDLYTAKESLLIHSGLKKEELVDLNVELPKFEKELKDIMILSNSDVNYSNKFNSVNSMNDSSLNSLKGVATPKMKANLLLSEIESLFSNEKEEIFIAEDVISENKYLCTKIQNKKYIVCSAEGVEEFQNNKITLRNFIKSKKEHFLYEVVHSQENSVPELRTSNINIHQYEDKLPDVLLKDFNTEIIDSIKEIEKFLMDNNQINLLIKFNKIKERL